eukprot:gene5945-6547_t
MTKKATKKTTEEAAAQQAKKVEEEHEEEEEELEEDDDEEEEDEDPLADKAPEVVRRVKALRKLHGEYDALQEEYKRERAALESKFTQKRQVIFDHRKKIVAGEHEPTPEPDDETNGAVSEENIKGVPEFWINVLSEHPEVGGLIAEEDIPALNALTDITVSYDEAFKTFTLSFHFQDNEHFTNAVLTKTYTVEPTLHDEFPTLQDVQVSPIDWKVGKNLTMAEVQKKQKAKSGRNKGQVRTVTRTVPKPSFFNFFKVPGKGEDGEEEEEEEEQDQQFGARVKFNIDEDYDIAHIFRTSIIPEAVLYVLREKDFSHLYGFEMDDDEEDDDEEGDEDEEEEEEETGAGKKKQGKGKAAEMAEKPQECKQN